MCWLLMVAPSSLRVSVSLRRRTSDDWSGTPTLLATGTPEQPLASARPPIGSLASALASDWSAVTSRSALDQVRCCCRLSATPWADISPWVTDSGVCSNSERSEERHQAWIHLNNVVCSGRHLDNCQAQVQVQVLNPKSKGWHCNPTGYTSKPKLILTEL